MVEPAETSPGVSTFAAPARSYPRVVEILLWLVPTGVVTLVAMVWAGWVGRESRGAVDREVAVQRMGEALGRRPGHGYAAERAPSDRSTGIAVRPSSRRAS